MPESMGGLSYNKNYVSRSRMEEVLLQDEQKAENEAKKSEAPAEKESE